MKKIFLITLSILFAFSVYAKDTVPWSMYGKRVPGPNVVIGGTGIKAVVKKNSKQVGLVGKIIIRYSGDMDIVCDYRGIDESIRDNPTLYAVSKLGNADKTAYESGELFCVSTKVDKEGNIGNFKKEGAFVSFPIYFRSNEKLKVYAPIKFKFKAPEDEKFLYIGTIIFEYTGSDFVLKTVTYRDEYDEAQKWLEEQTGTDEYRLCRVDFKLLK